MKQQNTVTQNANVTDVETPVMSSSLPGVVADVVADMAKKENEVKEPADAEELPDADKAEQKPAEGNGTGPEVGEDQKSAEGKEQEKKSEEQKRAQEQKSSEDHKSGEDQKPDEGLLFEWLRGSDWLKRFVDTKLTGDAFSRRDLSCGRT